MKLSIIGGIVTNFASKNDRISNQYDPQMPGQAAHQLQALCDIERPCEPLGTRFCPGHEFRSRQRDWPIIAHLWIYHPQLPAIRSCMERISIAHARN
jgi:hypothetical protein